VLVGSGVVFGGAMALIAAYTVFGVFGFFPFFDHKAGGAFVTGYALLGFLGETGPSF